MHERKGSRELVSSAECIPNTAVSEVHVAAATAEPLDPLQKREEDEASTDGRTGESSTRVFGECLQLGLPLFSWQISLGIFKRKSACHCNFSVVFMLSLHRPS